MKTKINQFLFCVGLIHVLLITSCSQGEGPEKVSNQVVIDGRALPLIHGYISEGFIRTDVNGAEGLWYYIFLTSSNLTFNESLEPEGNGDVIIFELTSTSTTSLPNGIYHVNNSFNVGTAFVDLVENFDADLYVSDKIYTSSPGGGSVTITKSGEKYILKFSTTLTNDDSGAIVEATGSFEGLLTEIGL